MHVLTFSIIMLNTDRHSPQVKKRMTLEEFVRNNRGINGGADLPRALLVRIFQSISDNEIRLKDQDVLSQAVSPARILAKTVRATEAAAAAEAGGPGLSTLGTLGLNDQELFLSVRPAPRAPRASAAARWAGAR